MNLHDGETAARPRDVRVAAAVGLITLAVFLPALRNGFVNFWDDRVTVIDDPMIAALSWGNLRAMFTSFLNGHYQPLSLLSLALDRAVWGLNPAGYHLTAALLHAVNTVLVFFLITALLELTPLRDRAARRLPLAAGFGALLFSLHPLRVESVAWVTERRDLLSGLFFLLALLAYVKARSGAVHRSLLPVAGWMLAGLFSKSILVTLPAVLLALDLYPLRRLRFGGGNSGGAGAGEPPGRVLLEKLPFLLLAIPFMIAAHAAQAASGAMSGSLWRGAADRAGMAADALVFYVEKTLWPSGLSPLYALRPAGPGAVRIVLCLSLLAAALALGVRALRRQPWIPAAMLAGLALLAPVLGFFQSGAQRAADRYTYLALLPLAVIAAAGWAAVTAGARPRAVRALSGALAAGLLFTLSALTLRQIPVWHDPLTLWTRVLGVEPDSRVGRIFLEREREFAAAQARIPARVKAVESDPENSAALLALADDLAVARQCAAAVGRLERFIARHPDDRDALRSRAGCLQQLGGPENLRAAIRDFDRIAAAAPGDAASLLASAFLYQQLGDDAGAEPRFARGLRLAPDDWASRANHAVSLAKLGRRDEAAAEMSLAWRQAPRWGRAMVEKRAAELGLPLNP